MARPSITGVQETLHDLVDYLSQLKLKIYLSPTSASLLNNKTLPIYEKEKLASHIDLVIVVGGDGSMLSAAKVALHHQLPVIGIHRGRLGFLTDIHPDQFNQLKSVLEGDFTQEQRFLINTQIKNPNTGAVEETISINDTVLMLGELAHMIEFDTYINDELIYQHRADGLIIATPTGSTAYALSGGGPILQPQLNALVLVPMFPHTLSSRPIVVNADDTIKLMISEVNEAPASLSCDGGPRITVPVGAQITITKHNKQLTLIHPKDYDYYHTLREKLGWEKHARRQ